MISFNRWTTLLLQFMYVAHFILYYWKWCSFMLKLILDFSSFLSINVPNIHLKVFQKYHAILYFTFINIFINEAYFQFNVFHNIDFDFFFYFFFATSRNFWRMNVIVKGNANKSIRVFGVGLCVKGFLWTETTLMWVFRVKKGRQRPHFVIISVVYCLLLLYKLLYAYITPILCLFYLNPCF